MRRRNTSTTCAHALDGRGPESYPLPMATANKTVPTAANVGEFIAAVPHPTRRAEAELLARLMAEVTGEPAVMWGTAMVGFGTLHLTYDTGRELDVPRAAFSPRKAQSVVYINGGFDEYSDLLPRLGPHSTGASCLYLKRVADADPEALRELIDRSYRWTPPSNQPR